LDPQPLLDDALLRLCRWLAEYYMCSLGEALSAALPGSVRITLERIVRVGTAARSADLKPAEQALLAWLDANGAQTIRAVTDHFGVTGRRTLQALERQGCVTMEEHLRGGSAPTKHERYYRVARDLAADELPAWQRKRPAQY